MHFINTYFPNGLSSLSKIVSDSLCKFQGGELFVESYQYEGLTLNDGVVTQYNVGDSDGFSLRGFKDESSFMVSSSSINEKELHRVADYVKGFIPTSGTHSVKLAPEVIITPNANDLYTSINSIDSVPFQPKFALTQKLEAMIRDKEPNTKNVVINLVTSWQSVLIIREDGSVVSDVRPLIKLGIRAVVVKNGIIGQGRSSSGGRVSYLKYFNDALCEALVNDVIIEANANIEAKVAPAGEMTVVLGSGWPGILLHEAIGHGLESDFNRKGTSVYSDSLGEMIASPCVTVVDDGTIYARRGSINIDDEGTKTQRNVLIENGRLVGYMHDRLNAKLMGVSPTGNGRRDGYNSIVMPRMTNTFMICGNYESDEIIASVKRGLYAMNFGGGQVDVTSGSFVFSSSRAYMIENGKITYPVKDCSLIGKGSAVLKSISMVGNDLKLDDGAGTCSKNGQQIPVGVGQPTLKINAITVGGTGGYNLY